MSPDSDDRRGGLWKDIVVPTAIGLREFFWSLMWFALVAGFLFGSLLFPRPAAQGGPQDERSTHERAVEGRSAAEEAPR